MPQQKQDTPSPESPEKPQVEEPGRWIRCPSRLDCKPALIQHRIEAMECQKRQERLFHRCAQCVYASVQTRRRLRATDPEAQPDRVLANDGKFIYKVAADRLELEKAFRLATVAAQDSRGKALPAKMKLSLCHAHPNTLTFLTLDEDEQAIATVTCLVDDAVLGLPMDEPFREELDKLRKKGYTLAELSGFTIHPKSLESQQARQDLAMILFQLSYLYCRKLGHADTFCIAVPPRHRDYYRKLMGFEEAGPKRAGHVPMFLSLVKAEEAVRKNEGTVRELDFYHRMAFFPQRARVLARLCQNRFRWTPYLLAHFFYEHTNLFDTADPEKLEYLKSCYPEIT